MENPIAARHGHRHRRSADDDDAMAGWSTAPGQLPLVCHEDVNALSTQGRRVCARREDLVLTSAFKVSTVHKSITSRRRRGEAEAEAEGARFI